MIIAAIETNIHESRKEWIIWMLKRAGAKNSNNKVYPFWQQDNHPIALSSNEMIDQRLTYLHENPVRAGIVREAGDYKYSSAIDYYQEEKGLLTLEMM